MFRQREKLENDIESMQSVSLTPEEQGRLEDAREERATLEEEMISYTNAWNSLTNVDELTSIETVKEKLSESGSDLEQLKAACDYLRIQVQCDLLMLTKFQAAIQALQRETNPPLKESTQNSPRLS